MAKYCLTQPQAEGLLQIWEEIAAETEVQKVIGIVVQNAKEICSAEKAVLALIEGEKLCFVGGTGEDPNLVGRLRVDLGVGIPGKVAKDGLVRRVENGIYRSPVSGVAPFSHPKEPIRSTLCVPMLFQGEPTGVIQVINKADDGAFSAEDECALQLLANQGAAGIARMRLHESALKESQRIRGIFEALTDGIMVVDPAGNPLQYNKAVEEMFFPGNAPNFALTTYLSQIVQSGSLAGSSEVVLFKPHNLILSNRFVQIRDRQGKLLEVVISIRNITDQRAVDRRFSQFYAIMLHKSKAVVTHALKARKSIQHRKLLRRQSEILRNLLFLTELKSGPLRIEKENCDILGLYKTARKRLAPRLKRKGISLVDAPFDLEGPQGGRFDRQRILQVFHLLLRKGLRMPPPSGEIWLGQESIPGKIRLNIGFAGKRISEDINPESLDWNRQVDAIIAGDVKSLNLDLSFIGHIVRAHKGSIEVNVENPQRVNVAITLPLEV